MDGELLPRVVEADDEAFVLDDGTVVHFASICEVTALDFSGAAFEKYDVTGPCDMTRRYRLGLADPGIVSFSMLYRPTEPGQVAMREAYLARVPTLFRVTVDDSLVELVFSAFVQNATLSAAVDTLIVSNVTLQLDGEPEQLQYAEAAFDYEALRSQQVRVYVESYRVPVPVTDFSLLTTIPVEAIFSRPSPAFVTDHDGVLRAAMPDEVRFAGARRVQNWCPKSEDFTHAYWLKLQGGTGAIPVVTAGFADPLGGMKACRILFDLGATPASATSRLYTAPNQEGVNMSTANGRTAKSMWLKSNTGANVTLYMVGDTISAHLITVTPTWQRFGFYTSLDYGIAGSGQIQFGLSGVGGESGGATTSAIADVLVFGAQIEDVSGATNKAPGEYVSRGALSAPWQGANYDGVQYFPTVNGNVVRANLLKRSNSFDLGEWNKTYVNGVLTPNAGTSPSGANDAWTHIESAAAGQQRAVFQGMQIHGGETYTFSVHAKPLGAGAKRYIMVYPQSTLGNAYAVFDLEAVAVVDSSGGSQYVSAAIAAVGNGWYRCSVVIKFDPAGNDYANAVWYLVKALGQGIPYDGDGVSGLRVWGYQVELGSLSPYIPTTDTAVFTPMTAGVGAAIPDATLLGYYYEGQRGNALLNSQVFSGNADWGAYKTTFQSTADIAPDGSATATRLLNGTAALPDDYGLVRMAIYAGPQGTFSIFAKAGTSRFVALAFKGDAATSGAIFELAGAGAIKSIASAYSAAIYQLGNGWYRCSITCTTPAQANGYWVVRICDNTGDQWYPSAGPSLSLSIWGAQFEADAPHPSSYVPTAATTATRIYDVMYAPCEGNLPELDFTISFELTRPKYWASNSEGTSSPVMIGTYATDAAMGFGGYGNSMPSGGNVSALCSWPTVWSAVANSATPMLFGAPRKVAGTLDADGKTLRLTHDGEQVGHNVASEAKATPWAGGSFYIGYPGSAHQSACIRKFKVWNVALPTSELQAMTAP